MTSDVVEKPQNIKSEQNVFSDQYLKKIWSESPNYVHTPFYNTFSGKFHFCSDQAKPSFKSLLLYQKHISVVNFIDKVV